MFRFFSNIIGLLGCVVLFNVCGMIPKPIKMQAEQGIQGQVFEQNGNQMPLKDKPFSKGRGYATKIYVFEPTTIQSAIQVEGSLFKKPITKLIASIDSDSNGRFKISLSPGKYSVLVGYENAYYASSFNRENEMGIVQILPGKFNTIDLIISIKASF